MEYSSTPTIKITQENTTTSQKLKDFSSQLDTFEFEVVKKCSEYWRENMSKLEEAKDEEISELRDLLSFVADFFEYLIEAQVLVIRDSEDSDSDVKKKMVLAEDILAEIISSRASGERLSNAARLALMTFYAQGLNRERYG